MLYLYLLVFHGPVDLVVVAGAEVDHHVLVPEEEHHRARVVQLVHLVEVCRAKIASENLRINEIQLKHDEFVSCFRMKAEGNNF